MLAVTRHRVEPAQAPDFRVRATRALRVLAGRPGCRGAQLARAMDDPELWLLLTSWVDVGSFRRALGAYEVRMEAVPLLSCALDEPGAFEVLEQLDPSAGGAATASAPSRRAADASTVGLGSAAAPYVRTDLDPAQPPPDDGRDA